METLKDKPYNSKELEGKRVLVTGGTKGIGEFFRGCHCRG